MNYLDKILITIKESKTNFNNEDYVSTLDNLEYIRKINKEVYDKLSHRFKEKLFIWDGSFSRTRHAGRFCRKN